MLDGTQIKYTTNISLIIIDVTMCQYSSLIILYFCHIRGHIVAVLFSWVQFARILNHQFSTIFLCPLHLIVSVYLCLMACMSLTARPTRRLERMMQTNTMNTTSSTSVRPNEWSGLPLRNVSSQFNSPVIITCTESNI